MLSFLELFQKTMFDVRIFHLNADSYKDRDIKQVYIQHENMKRKNYEQREPTSRTSGEV